MLGGELSWTGSPRAAVRWVIRMSIATALVMSGSRSVSAQLPGIGHSVCDRTFQVSAAIVTASGAATCADVTVSHLREITSLDLRGQGIASVSVGDFDGLVRLHTLDLSDNILVELPQHAFDELLLLRRLHLDGNLLWTLPANLFDRLLMLEELTLDGNPLLVHPTGMLADPWPFAAQTETVVLPNWGIDAGSLDGFVGGVNTVEEFIAALPALYKERFAMVFASESPARDHVSGDYPRMVSFGGDGRFVFSWNTDPAAPAMFRDGVEFLRRNDTEWSAGIIDFSGGTPTVTEPASCRSCHGPLNKPLWGTYTHWRGTDFDRNFGGETRQAFESTNPRIEPLDFSASRVLEGRRYFRADCAQCFATVEEAGNVMAWRHAEVLLRRLKGREDFRQFAENTVCGSESSNIRKAALAPFNIGDHHLAVRADTGRIIHLRSGTGSFLGPDHFYGVFGKLGGALTFLLVVELWEQEAIVRKLYREVSNSDTLSEGWTSTTLSSWLYYAQGEATAEDELIMKLRLHFGNGNPAALADRTRQNERLDSFGGATSAAFFEGHLEVMAPRVCDVLRNTKPGNLTVELVDGDAVLDWDAPEDVSGLSGYRILRGVAGETPTSYEDTGNTDTTWTDGDLVPGDYEWILQALFGSYPSPESNAVHATVSGGPLEVSGPTSFTILEGDTEIWWLTATDNGGAGANLVWSMAGGADSGHFTLSEDGSLAFVAEKDYEAPDDANGDGTYELAVRVSDGTEEDTADVRVSLSNRNEAPTAKAGSDQSGVAESATVTLRGAGEDPDVGDTLQFAWTQVSGVTVELSAPSDAETTFTAPNGLTEDAVLKFRLTVTDAGKLAGEDTVTVTVVAAEEPELTASFHGMPASHEGATSFTFELRFSEEVVLSYVTLRDSAFTVTNGSVAKARRLNPPSNVRWEIAIAPSSLNDITIVLPGERSCDSTGAVCTSDGRSLTGSVRATVEATEESDTPLTAGFHGVPAEHDGETAFTFELRFSEEVALSYVTLRDSAFTVTNGSVAKARRLNPPSNVRWEIAIEPSSPENITIVLPGGRSCGAEGAICTAGAKQLSNSPSVTVR